MIAPHRSLRHALASATLLVVSAPVVLGAGPKADFNGDGFEDLVCGAPLHDNRAPGFFLHREEDTGMFELLSGSVDRLTAAGDTSFDDNNSIGFNGFKRYAAALAAGDFDGDGYTDLAVGSPGRNGTGAVRVYVSDSSGLRTLGSELITQGSDGVEEDAEEGDDFGASLAAGDFDGDGYDDLAIGTPHENVLGASGTAHGAVNVLYGTPSGLSAARDQLWTQDAGGIADACEGGDHFGSALAVGDFDHDGRDDLAIGVPGEDNGATPDEGRVHVLFGTASSGLTGQGSVVLDRRIKIIATLEDTSRYEFGSALAAGDMNGDGADDLAIGMPGDDVGSAVDAGSVIAFFGQTTRSFTRLSAVINEETGGVPGTAGPGDRFGAAITIGRFGVDGFGDLAIGAPGDAVGSASGAGSVTVIFGASFGPNFGAPIFVLTQNFLHSGVSEAGDAFGSALTHGDYDGDGFDDLAIGVPLEDDGEPDCGVVHVVYGELVGLDTNDAELWSQGTFGVNGTREDGAQFGSALR